MRAAFHDRIVLVLQFKRDLFRATLLYLPLLNECLAPKRDYSHTPFVATPFSCTELELDWYVDFTNCYSPIPQERPLTG